jgi:type I restriction enzyme, S subunit
MNKVGWKTKTLGEACLIARGGSPRPIQEFMTNGPDGVNWVKISDATASGKYIYTTKEKIKPSGVSRSRLVKPGDFLLSNSMSFGRPYIMQTTGCIHDGWLVLSEYEKSFDQSFLYHLLGSPVVFEQFDTLAAGSTVRNLNIELASRVSLPVPPLPAQHRIVAILDTAFDHIATAKANCEANLLNARAIFESHLQAVFTQRGDGWIEKNFGDIATFRNGINFTKSSKGESIRILGVKDFQSHFWAPMDNLDFVIPDGKLPASDTLLQDDLVFVRSNGNPELIGRCLLVPEASERTTHSGFTIRARLNSSVVLPIYLCHFLKSSVMRREMIDGGNGVNIKSLNQGTLAGLAIPFPSLSLQTDIVRQINALKAETQRLESLCQRKLQALDDLKKSLLHRAFSGAL